MKIAKAIAGAFALAASTALGFLPHDDPWFNVLTAVVAIAGTYGIYQIPNRKPTPRQEAIGAAVGSLAADAAGYLPGVQEPAPAKTFPAAAVAAAARPSIPAIDYAPAPNPLEPVETTPLTTPAEVPPAPTDPTA